MSQENGIVDFTEDFLPYFREHYPQFKGSVMVPDPSDPTGSAMIPDPSDPRSGPFTDSVLEGYFDYATNFAVSNDPNHRPRICWKRRLILYCYLVCHQADLWKRGMGVVGSITSASQGSVSQSVSPLQTNQNNQWLGQTQWGQMFLNAIRLYTGLRYVQGPRSNWK